MSAGKRWFRRFGVALLGMVLCVAGQRGEAQQNWASMKGHTDPLNLDPTVQKGLERFYILDYDGALKIFNGVTQQHGDQPMAWNYVLLVTIFKELYHQDLLDTTYYAHDSFLSNKRDVQVQKATREQIESLTAKVEHMCDERIKANDRDKDAYFARGYARGLHASFVTLADHAFATAAKQGYAARNDSEEVLKIDPDYADAKMAIGIQQFAVASLPRFVRLMVGIMGVGGSKQKGLDLLADAGAHGPLNNVQARTAESLFLRHDGRYPESLTVQRTLANQYPHDFLFRLEVANLLKDGGHGEQAMAEYRQVLADAAKPGFFIDPHLQMAYFGLGDTQRGYNDIEGSAQSFAAAASQPNSSDWLRKRAALNAGEMFDLLKNRAEALKWYAVAAAPGGDQTQADAAHRYQQTPYVKK